MRLVIQKVCKATVTSVEKGTIAGTIDKGLLVLIGITHSDNMEIVQKFAQKLLTLKLWSSLDGSKPNYTNIMENKLELLIVSQFTLYGTLKGNKPDFHHALQSKDAFVIYEQFLQELGKCYDPTKIGKGAFGEYMSIDASLDGPATILIDSEKDK